MKHFSDYPMPVYQHVPGVNPRPDLEQLEHIASLAHNHTTSATAANNVAWRYGIRLFNEGFYWEAHEVLETVWINALPNSRERYLLQAIIHIANSALKHAMQRQNAADRLSGLALESLNRAFPAGDSQLMGIEATEITGIAKACNQGQAELIIREH